MIPRCPICDTRSVELVWEADRVPILPMLRLVESPQPDHFGELRIVRCLGCGHLYNEAYDAASADRMYGGELLSNVPVHVSMAKNLQEVAEWIGRAAYEGKRVVEIGSGSAHLARILAQSAAHMQLFEPCKGLRPAMLPQANISLINESFSASRVEQPAELIVCRQVLEHVADPLAMLRQIRSVLSDTGTCYLEVPCAEYIEEHAALFDLHYPHVQYFHEPNLLRLASRAGLVPVRSWHLKQGHDVGVLLRPRETAATGPSGPAGVAPKALRRRLEDRRARIRAWLASVEGPVCLYGATAQGVAFLHVFQSDGRFAAVADDNPSYEGYALYSAAQCVPVVRATDAVVQRASHVVVAAYLHDAVIEARLRESGFLGQIFSLRDPAPAFSEAGS